MYCSNCGKQIPDNSKFCNFCGAEQIIYSQTSFEPNQSVREQRPPVSPVPPRQTQAGPQNGNQKKPKNHVGRNILISLAVFVVVAMFSRAFITPLFLRSVHKDEPSPAPSTTFALPEISVSPFAFQTEPAQPTAAITSEYSEIFSSRGIPDEDEPLTYDAWLTAQSFAQVSSDGIVEKMQFGYDPEEDSVVELFDVLYVPTADLTAEELMALDIEIRDYLSQYEIDNFCTIEYEMYTTYDYYKATVHFSDINNSYNIQRLSDIGLLPATDSTSGQPAEKISMRETESTLLMNGYVQKK